jgi:hypothetical protein
MINGFDDIDYLQNIKEEVVAFANQLHTNTNKLVVTESSTLSLYCRAVNIQ